MLLGWLHNQGLRLPIPNAPVTGHGKLGQHRAAKGHAMRLGSSASSHANINAGYPDLTFSGGISTPIHLSFQSLHKTKSCSGFLPSIFLFSAELLGKASGLDFSSTTHNTVMTMVQTRSS